MLAPSDFNELRERLKTVIRQANDNQTAAIALVGLAVTEVLSKSFHIDGIATLNKELKILNHNLKELSREVTYLRGRL